MPFPLIADGNPTAPVYPGDVSTPDGFAPDPKYTDAAVLSIVVTDWETSSNWLNNRLWVLQWRECQTLYQSPRSQAVFEGSSVTRANVSRFDVARSVNSLAPALTSAVFSDTIPFEIQPRPNVHQNSARAWKELLAVLLDMVGFKEALTRGIESMVLMGTVIFKIGWEEYTEKVTRWERKQQPTQINMPLGGPPVLVFTKETDEFKKVEEDVVKKRPIFEKCEIATIFPNPKWKGGDIGNAGWVVQEHYINYDDLMKLRQDEEYDIPDDETLRFIFTTGYESTDSGSAASRTMHANASIFLSERDDADFSEDPLLKPMQVLEWSSETEIRVVLQQKVVIRNGKHTMGRVPYLSSNFWNVDDAGYGLGVGRIAGSDQRVDQALTNSALDIIAFAVQPEYMISRGANVPTQDLRRRLGGIRLVDGDVRTAMKLVEQPTVPPDAWRALQVSTTTADSTTGADQAAVQGSLPGRGSSVGRSGTGAGMLQAASQGRLQAPVERIVDGVLIPFLKFLWEQVRQRLTVQEIRAILGNTYAEAIMVDFQDFYNADLHFDTLAGTRLAARARMAQAMPFLLEVFGNQALVQQMSQIGWKVNVLELANMVMDVSGWKNKRDLITPMTDQEKQQMVQSQQAAGQAQMQGKMALQQQKEQADQALEDTKIKGRIATKALTTQHEHLIESPLDRASSFAERTADEKGMQQSQFFGNPGSSTS
jgi:hypothetical protein